MVKRENEISHYKKVYFLIVALVGLAGYLYFEFVIRIYHEGVWIRSLQVIGAIFLVIIYHYFSVYTFKSVKNQAEMESVTKNEKLYSHMVYAISSIVWVLVNCYISIGLVVAIFVSYHQTNEWILNVIFYVLILCIFGGSYYLSFQKKMYVKFTQRQLIEQTIIYILFFCVVIPSIIMTVDATEGSEIILGNIVIVVNAIIAGVIAILVQGYKNAFDNSKGSVYFGNMYQDSSALLVLLATLELNMENPIGYQCTLIIIYIIVCFLRSNRECKKW
ncbi:MULTISPECIES: hypothetical protein [unclassified Bacillus cereus group]|uniref:hypothetical protein n=1 Tax=unclassified Bacillus cereus group TaxID=2750818 RepID=UPI0022DFF2C0|nr:MULTISPECIES: hypothetical protein [unclassified Bacillus cereus group]MDA1646052.1 hypothetical protein [Bacillus cereus group sp. TH163-1LC]MDA1795147.1 hypothetical protein [Bacillus cereus group sp. BY8-1LC]